MKITFLGNMAPSYASEIHHSKSLEALGHTIVRLQEGQVSGEEILQACDGADMLCWVHTHGRYPLGNMLMPEVTNILRSKNVPVVTYHLDLYLGINREHELLPGGEYDGVDYFFTVDKLMVDWLHKNTRMKAYFLPPAVFNQECILLEAQPADYDVVFVGSRRYHPEWYFRPLLIDYLRYAYGNKFLHVGGDSDTGTVRELALNQIYSNAKIAVGDSLNINFEYPYYVSDRLFESIGRGAFTIFPYIVGLEEYFTDEKEIIYYEHGNLKDLKHKIDYWLTHDEEREKIRKAGQARCAREGTYINRWQVILETVCK